MTTTIWGEILAGFEAAIYGEDTENPLPYRWLKVGEAVDPPMVLFLHGAGERGNDNKVQLKHGITELVAWLRDRGESAVVVAPQCPPNLWWLNFEGSPRAETPIQLSDEISPVMAAVLEVVESMATEHKVDRGRIYVTGLSMGGFGTFAAVARRPDLFAAAIPICGGGDPKTAERLKGVPFWVFHGSDDEVVPLKASETMVEALKKVYGEVKFHVYPTVGHDSWTETYRNPDVWTWLFAQKKTPARDKE